MHDSVVFVCPRGVAKDALDGEIGFDDRLFLSDGRGKPVRDFVTPLNHVFGDVIDDLRAETSGRFCPAGGSARRFYRIANVFAVAEGRLAEQLAFSSINRE